MLYNIVSPQITMGTNYNELQITMTAMTTILYNEIDTNYNGLQWQMTSMTMDYNDIQYCKSTNYNDYNNNGLKWNDLQCTTIL